MPFGSILGSNSGKGGGAGVPAIPAAHSTALDYDLRISTGGEATWEQNTGGGTGGGEANVQANWAETTTTDDSFIRNKPAILSESQVDARVRRGVYDWAEVGNNERIPSGKLGNAPTGITVGQVDARIAPWARSNAGVAVPGNLLGNAPGLRQDAVDARVRDGVADWAETGNTEHIPTDKLPDFPVELPAGGHDGQLLARSGTDDVEWVDAPTGGGGGGGGAAPWARAGSTTPIPFANRPGPLFSVLLDEASQTFNWPDSVATHFREFSLPSGLAFRDENIYAIDVVYESLPETDRNSAHTETLTTRGVFVIPGIRLRTSPGITVNSQPIHGIGTISVTTSLTDAGALRISVDLFNTLTAHLATRVTVSVAELDNRSEGATLVERLLQTTAFGNFGYAQVLDATITYTEENQVASSAEVPVQGENWDDDDIYHIRAGILINEPNNPRWSFFATGAELKASRFLGNYSLAGSQISLTSVRFTGTDGALTLRYNRDKSQFARSSFGLSVSVTKFDVQSEPLQLLTRAVGVEKTEIATWTRDGNGVTGTVLSTRFSGNLRASTAVRNYGVKQYTKAVSSGTVTLTETTISASNNDRFQVLWTNSNYTFHMYEVQLLDRNNDLVGTVFTPLEDHVLEFHEPWPELFVRRQLTGSSLEFTTLTGLCNKDNHKMKIYGLTFRGV